MACHLDTVPVAGPVAVGPVGGELVEGLVHGRGAADIKAGVVAAGRVDVVIAPYGLVVVDGRVQEQRTTTECAAGASPPVPVARSRHRSR
ncbi:M20/M25/M40 family metallo-hydrolase [Kineococcus sp. SYSU DK006]|uniref:M20/M25/M40 family metallo-hydrolase n=1 Tax=Kineococcus sp. SYSU DK006 TaxID=3383127 RepID=UPI003D7F080A